MSEHSAPEAFNTSALGDIEWGIITDVNPGGTTPIPEEGCEMVSARVVCNRNECNTAHELSLTVDTSPIDDQPESLRALSGAVANCTQCGTTLAISFADPRVKFDFPEYDTDSCQFTRNTCDATTRKLTENRGCEITSTADKAIGR